MMREINSTGRQLALGAVRAECCPSTRLPSRIMVCSDQSGRLPQSRYLSNRRVTMRTRAWIAGIVVAIIATPVHSSALYKCVTQDGRTTYSENPCGNGAKRLQIPGEEARQRSEESSLVELKRRLAEREKADAANEAYREIARKQDAQKQRCAMLRMVALQAGADANAFDQPDLRKAARLKKRMAEERLAAECLVM
jgi:hypothetical protein